MNRKTMVWLATGAAILVAAGSLGTNGWDPAGLASAARNTARFSGIVFALALIARSRRSPRSYAQRWDLFFAFVAAHAVHYVFVAMLAIFDTGHELHRLQWGAVITLTGGFGLLLLAAITAGTAMEPFRSRAHTFFFYVLGIIFLVGFGSRALQAPASAAIFAVVVLGFVVRALPAGRPATLSTSA